MTEQRYRAVLEVLAGVPVTEVADRYGVSRQSVHAWLVRYRDQGPPGLADRSDKVRAHPWQIPAELEAAVCELRRAHRKWGPKRLVFEMGCRGLGTVTLHRAAWCYTRAGPVGSNPSQPRLTWWLFLGLYGYSPGTG